MDELTQSKIQHTIHNLEELGYSCTINESEYNNEWYDVRIKKDDNLLSLITLLSGDSVYCYLFGYYCAIVDLKHYEVFC